MKIKTNDLLYAALDWAVKKALGWEGSIKPSRCFDCRHYEERMAADEGQRFCKHPRFGGWAEIERMSGDVWDECPILDTDAPPYSTDWSQGGPIIEREKISVRYRGGQWVAEWWADNSGMAKKPAQRFVHNRFVAGPTPLIAAMRCYVASKMGNDVNIPSELEAA